MEIYFAHMLGHLGISQVNPLIQDSVRYWLLVFQSSHIHLYRRPQSCITPSQPYMILSRSNIDKRIYIIYREECVYVINRKAGIISYQLQ